MTWLSGRLLDEPKEKQQTQGIGVVGRIKIGEKRKNAKGKEYPVSLDYFKADAPENYIKMFQDACGEKPERIQVAFISDDITHSCNVRYELRDNQGKLYSKGDGQVFEFVQGGDWVSKSVDQLITKFGSMEQFKKKSAEFCKSQKGWEVRLTLRFIIPQIKGLLGEWQLSTKGKETSINQIVNSFDSVKENAGTIIMIPFDLIVKKVKSDKSGDNRSYPVISLIPNIHVDSLKLLSEYTSQGVEAWRNGLLTEEKILALNS